MANKKHPQKPSRIEAIKSEIRSAIISGNTEKVNELQAELDYFYYGAKKD